MDGLVVAVVSVSVGLDDSASSPIEATFSPSFATPRFKFVINMRETDEARRRHVLY